MKNLTAVIGLIVCLMLAGSAFAVQVIGGEDHSEDMIHVICRVDPNIAVDAGEDVRIASLQTGDVSGDLPFRIDANTQWIQVTIIASNLYKGNDPFSLWRIPLSVGHGAEISVVGGNPVPYGAQFTTATDVYQGFQGYGSDPVTIESGQSGRFSQDLIVRVTWFNQDPELPVGDYSGWVRLLGAVLPSGPVID